MKYFLWVLFTTLTFSDCHSQDLFPFCANNLWGYIDLQGAVKIEPQYQYASKFLHGTAIVAKQDSLGAIDKKGALVIPYMYQFLQPLDSSEFLFGFRAKYFGEYSLGVLTKDQTTKISPEYDYIAKRNGTYTVVKKQDTIIGKGTAGDIRSIESFYGLLDSNGKVLIPCQYNYLDWVNDSLIVLTQGKSGTNQALFNRRGEQLTGFEYMVIGQFIEGVAKARIMDKYGFIHPSGKVAIPIQFDYCEDFNQGYAIIQQRQKWGAISKDGKIMIKPLFGYEEVKSELKRKYIR